MTEFDDIPYLKLSMFAREMGSGGLARVEELRIRTTRLRFVRKGAIKDIVLSKIYANYQMI